MQGEGTAAFYGLKGPGRSEIVIKRSRFLGYAWPAHDEARALEGVERLRREHPDARHVCFAYRVGLGREAVRMSDDGEPGGTAGKPILEVLIQGNVRNAAVAVVRYFGGVLLGAPGLVRAYSQAAALAVADAGPVPMVPHFRCTLELPYGLLDGFRHFLQRIGAVEERCEYGAAVTVTAAVPAAHVEALTAWARGAGLVARWEEEPLYLPPSALAP